MIDKLRFNAGLWRMSYSKWTSSIFPWFHRLRYPTSLGSQPPIPIILGRPFLATSNAIINCRNGVMKLSFGNMTVEMNVFKVSKQLSDEMEVDEVNLTQTLREEYFEIVMCEPISQELEE